MLQPRLAFPLLLLLFLGRATAQLSCPTGFTLVTSGAYSWCYSSSTTNFATAASTCTSNGLQMIELRTAEKAAAFDAVATNDYCWLGITCPGVNGVAPGTAASTQCQRNLQMWRWSTSSKGGAYQALKGMTSSLSR